jgi:hypothetical protein
MYSRLGIAKLISWSLLLIFLYNVAGYFFIFRLEQSVLKKETIQHIQFQHLEGQLKVIAFRNADLKNVEWMEQGEEMRYKGKLYDIARILKTADSTVYYCQSDEHEDQLYIQLDDHIKNHVLQSTSKKSSKKTAPKSFELYFLNKSSFSFTRYSIPIRIQTDFLNAYLPVYIELNAPPPWLS